MCRATTYSMSKELMDPDLSLLLSVARDLEKNDLKSMKFLVTGMNGIDAQWLDSVSSTTHFILELKQVYDMSFLSELLREIGRITLYKKLNASFDIQTSCRLSEVKALMFHIAQSMSKHTDLPQVAFYLGVVDKGYDAFGLMRLIETQKAVASLEDLRQVTSEFRLSHLLDKALSERAEAKPELKEVAKGKPVTSVARLPSLCDESGCDEGCAYRALWSDKFPHKLTPMFTNERLLSHDDLSTDGEDTAEELLGEGAFGKVYKGQ